MSFNVRLRHTHLFLTLDCPKGLAVGGMTLLMMLTIANVVIQGLLSSMIIIYIVCIILSYLVNVKGHDITV